MLRDSGGLDPALKNSVLQLLLIGIGYGPGGLLLQDVRFPEGDSPVQEEPKPGPHGMGAGFHDHKLPLGDGFQLVRRHQGPLCHLQSLGFILPGTDVAGEGCAAAHGFGQDLGGLTLRRKTAKNCVLRIVDYDLRTLFSIVFLQLCQ